MIKSSTLTIKEANQKQSGVFRDFLYLPYRLYEKNPNFIPPLLSEEKRFLNKKHNPFLQRNAVVFFVCYHEGKPVGRIAGIINEEHNQFHNDNTAFFGFFESINNDHVAKHLFQAVSQWVKKHNAKVLRGPTNFTLNDISGLLLDGFNEPPFIMMPYNPDYYEDLYRKNGFDIAMRFFAYDITQDTIKFPGFINKLEKRLEDSGITIRSLNFKELNRDFKIIVDIFNQAWHENWGFTPLSFEDAVEDFRKVKLIAKRDLLLIAEHKGEPAAFAIALPDINQALKPLKGRLLPFNWIKLFRKMRKIDQIRVLLMGVVSQYRNKGIDLMLYKKIVDHSSRYGYHRAELSWILENNQMMNRVLEHINAKKNKVYGIFEKSLNNHPN